jgi:hypothetical protein
MGKVLHASGSGYFTGCIEESTDSKYAVWPLEQAMQTYWRVRAWDFNADIIVRLFNFPEEGETLDLPFTVSVANIRQDAEDEPTLACYGEFTRDDGLDGFRKQADIFFFPAKKVGNLYYSGLGGFIDDGESGTEFAFWVDNQTYPSSQFPIPILGATLDLTAYNYGEEEESEVISCTASLTPSEWWSYGGTYNTSTGEPL